MPSFFNGKRFFLTYPQCNGTRQELKEFIMGKAPIRYILVARELHQDGHQHFHVCVEFEQVQRHDTRWLDFNGKHPNKQDPRKWIACKTYCKKEDEEFIEDDLGNLWPVEIDQSPESELMQKCFSYDKEEDWYAYCAGEKISFQYCQYFWSRLHGDLCTILDSTIVAGTICPALETFNVPGDCNKSIVLRGASGIGKTTWAKKVCPKPALFVSHLDQLKAFRPGFHKCIIFDDIDVKHHPRTNQIALVDCYDTRAIHCRHAVATIPAGILKVFTCNEWPVDKTDEAIARRCRFYTVSGWLNEINPN